MESKIDNKEADDWGFEEGDQINERSNGEIEIEDIFYMAEQKLNTDIK